MITLNLQLNHGSIETNSRISLSPQTGSQSAQDRLYKKDALDKQDQYYFISAGPDHYARKVFITIKTERLKRRL